MASGADSHLAVLPDGYPQVRRRPAGAPRHYAPGRATRIAALHSVDLLGHRLCTAAGCGRWSNRRRLSRRRPRARAIRSVRSARGESGGTTARLPGPGGSRRLTRKHPAAFEDPSVFVKHDARRVPPSALDPSQPASYENEDQQEVADADRRRWEADDDHDREHRSADRQRRGASRAPAMSDGARL